jgi:hypothetical protein
MHIQLQQQKQQQMPIDQRHALSMCGVHVYIPCCCCAASTLLASLTFAGIQELLEPDL